MSEFIVKIEDDIVQTLGRQNIEEYLKVFIAQTILKAAATDILKDYVVDDLSNDEVWLKARKEAFLKDRYSQYIKVYANIWLHNWYQRIDEYSY